MARHHASGVTPKEMPVIHSILLSSLVFLSACNQLLQSGESASEENFVSACNSAIQDRLKSPSSFLHLETTYFTEPLESTSLVEWKERFTELREKEQSQEFQSLSRRDELNIEIEISRLSLKIIGAQDPEFQQKKQIAIVQFEASNSFGASLKQIARCEYEAWSREFSNSDDADDVIVDGMNHTDWLIEGAKAFQ